MKVSNHPTHRVRERESVEEGDGQTVQRFLQALQARIEWFKSHGFFMDPLLASGYYEILSLQDVLVKYRYVSNGVLS